VESGTRPSVVAPGNNMRTFLSSGGYWSLFGMTSAATPHVSGQVALLWQANPELIGNIDATTGIIAAVETTDPIDFADACGTKADPPHARPNYSWGYGQINLPASIAAAKAHTTEIVR
jgi:subtilisin family serine protease